MNRKFWRTWYPLFPLGVLVASVLLALVFHRTSPSRMVLSQAFEAPSWSRPFGAAEAGVDLLAALTHSVARGLVLALCVSSFGFLVGVPLGSAAGLRGGKAAQLLGRICDFVQSFPSFLLALAVLAAVKFPNRWHIGVVFSLSAWAPFARMALLQTQVLAHAQFVEASRALGAQESRLVFRHILPNVLGPVSVQLGSSAAAVILGETALGFLGLGPRDGVSLGALLEQGSTAMLRAPHVLLLTSLSVAWVSASLQLASESLRKYWGISNT
jgi:peptide/nickel transport system permease protein